MNPLRRARPVRRAPPRPPPPTPAVLLHTKPSPLLPFISTNPQHPPPLPPCTGKRLLHPPDRTPRVYPYTPFPYGFSLMVFTWGNNDSKCIRAYALENDLKQEARI